MNKTSLASKKTLPMLRVKTHLKAGQGQAVCAAPQKAYQDGYNAGYGDAQRKGPSYQSGGPSYQGGGSIPYVWRPY